MPTDLLGAAKVTGAVGDVRYGCSVQSKMSAVVGEEPARFTDRSFR